MTKADNDNFADEFEGDEFEDENFAESEFDLTDENGDSATAIGRGNEAEPSFLDKLMDMKTPLIIAGVVILFLLGGVVLYKNISRSSENLVDAGSKYASKTETTVAAEAVAKPELLPTKKQNKEYFQQKFNQDISQQAVKVADSSVKTETDATKLEKQIDSKIAVTTAAITGMEDKVFSLSADLSSSVEHIKQLSEVILGLKSAIFEVNQTLAGMDSRILSLTETVDHLNSDVSNVKHVIKDEDLDIAKVLDKQPAETLVYSAPEYIVHAIIPGRAWLKTDSGQIITVAEGDVLGDYGKVAFIDASNGIIRTSSGMVFK